MAVGKLVADQVLELSAPLVVGGQQRVVRTTTAGGAPANVTAGVARLGAPTRLAGWAGADPPADGLLAGLAARGVEVAVVRRGRAPLSTVLVHPGGERTLLSDRGEGGLEPSDVRDPWVADAAVVHLDGYDLLRFPGALRAVASAAHGRGVPVSVDVAAATRIAAHGIGAYVDLLTGCGRTCCAATPTRPPSWAWTAHGRPGRRPWCWCTTACARPGWSRRRVSGRCRSSRCRRDGCATRPAAGTRSRPAC
ncbi:pfkB family carbohydrate kinase [Geodermatophilus tzadiensis]|uniref:PfkB family carbohydrate kinase n=1 Tax=Geodermatophilus tzadiensis TaxID=1137988 RepID=A0A2T0T189_9ACTN|nr:pfkB family carbohydrate kinase [Geodermatophilus tzadiensis]